jgi:hypothetical protein
MRISEIFGRSVDDNSADAKAIRAGKICPFRDTPCTKSSKIEPIGVCSLSDGKYAASLCPVRFLEDGRIFTDAAEIAFGKSVSFGVFPEVRVLKIDETADSKKIGKVDFILGHIVDGKIADFAAMEVQAVYFSGNKIGPAMNYFLENGRLDPVDSERRPDFRSSAQKRLAPQLLIKVPVFRRWGKKFFVAVDSQFFGSIPEFKHTPLHSSEIIWLNYPIENTGTAYKIQAPEVIGSVWDDVANSLREGLAPDKLEIIQELQLKLSGPMKTRPRMLST